jgi:hypothetical protein
MCMSSTPIQRGHPRRWVLEPGAMQCRVAIRGRTPGRGIQAPLEGRTASEAW